MRAKGFLPEDAVRELRVPVFAVGKIGAEEIDAPPAEASSFTAALASEVFIRS
jgi:hypothetical protein